MCARYSLTKEEITMIIGEIEIIIKIQARYNIAPKQKATVILEEGGQVKTQEMDWGWQPAWHKGLLVNGQGENVTTKPTFKKFFDAGQRCLIPADGFYEWTSDRVPIRFTQPGDRPFCFAGLWLETSRQEFDVPTAKRKFILLTTTPNTSVGKVHDRMPLIVQPQHYHWWTSPDGLASTVLDHPDREELQSCPVQPALNRAGIEGAELIRPYFPPQKELF